MKLLILPFIFLTGCMYQTSNLHDIEEAQEFCADKGGIVEVTADFMGAEFVLCKNNSTVKLHQGK